MRTIIIVDDERDGKEDKKESNFTKNSQEYGFENVILLISIIDLG